MSIAAWLLRTALDTGRLEAAPLRAGSPVATPVAVAWTYVNGEARGESRLTFAGFTVFDSFGLFDGDALVMTDTLRDETGAPLPQPVAVPPGFEWVQTFTFDTSVVLGL